jgi:hypothetical protein
VVRGLASLCHVGRTISARLRAGIVVTRPSQSRARDGEPRYTRAVNVLSFLVGVWPLIAIAYFVRDLPAGRITRRPARPLALPAADAVLRSTKRRALATVAGGMTLLALGWHVGDPIVLLYCLGFGLAAQRYLHAWRAQRLLALPRARASVRGTLLTADSDDAHATVAIPRRLAATALAAALPPATLR